MPPKLLKLILFLLFFSPVSLFAQTSLPFNGEVNSDNINVRADSTISAEKICALKKGDTVEAIQELYDWYKIRLPPNTAAFVKKKLVNTTDKKNGVIVKDNVNIRLKPNESSAIIGKLKINEPVSILEEAGGWYKIKAPNNSFGFINKKFITPKKN